MSGPDGQGLRTIRFASRRASRRPNPAREDGAEQVGRSRWLPLFVGDFEMSGERQFTRSLSFRERDAEEILADPERVIEESPAVPGTVSKPLFRFVEKLVHRGVILGDEEFVEESLAARDRFGRVGHPAAAVVLDREVPAERLGSQEVSGPEPHSARGEEVGGAREIRHRAILITDAAEQFRRSFVQACPVVEADSLIVIAGPVERACRGNRIVQAIAEEERGIAE